MYNFLKIHLDLTICIPQIHQKAATGIVSQSLTKVTFIKASTSHQKRKGLKSLNLALARKLAYRLANLFSTMLHDTVLLA